MQIKDENIRKNISYTLDGHCNQSKSSDIYSIGRVIKQINDKYLNLPALESIGTRCTKRPSTLDIKTTLHNLFLDHHVCVCVCVCVRPLGYSKRVSLRADHNI